MSAIAPTFPPSRGPLDRFLRLFTDVRDGEGPSAAAHAQRLPDPHRLLRDEAGAGGSDPRAAGGRRIKSYATALQVVLLAAAGAALWRARHAAARRRLDQSLHRVFHRLPRRLFYLAAPKPAVPVGRPLLPVDRGLQPDGDRPVLGDTRTTSTRRRPGKRLFAFIAFGASSGAVFGAFISGDLIT